MAVTSPLNLSFSVTVDDCCYSELCDSELWLFHGQPWTETYWGHWHTTQLGSANAIKLVFRKIKPLIGVDLKLFCWHHLTPHITSPLQAFDPVSTALDDFSSISKERTEPKQPHAKPLVSMWRRPLTIKSSTTAHISNKCQAAGIVKLHYCRSEEQSNYKFKGVNAELQELGRRGKTTWPLYYSGRVRRVCMCGCFKGIRSQQSIKTPLIPPAFHGHVSGGRAPPTITNPLSLTGLRENSQPLLMFHPWLICSFPSCPKGRV